MFNMNAKQMEKMMKQMGIQQEQIDADEVIIKTAGGEIVVSSPQVVKVKVGGQETFQITGEISERDKAESAEQKEKFSEEDAKLVSQQSGASLEDARIALEETGDIAEAIMKLKK
ncbi:MAG: nascent polypeptide-associated complex protein [Candidatus Aenigmatarchaeota archaeon]